MKTLAEVKPGQQTRLFKDETDHEGTTLYGGTLVTVLGEDEDGDVRVAVNGRKTVLRQSTATTGPESRGYVRY